MKTAINNLIGFISIVLLVACQKQTVYHSYQPISERGWAKSDTLFFHVPISDSTATVFRLYTEIRNKNAYAYQDVHIKLYHNLQDSTQWHTYPVSIKLTNKAGKWIGTGFGDLFQTETYVGSVKVTHPGMYTVKVLSNMTDDRLIGLSDLGIRIEK